MPWLRWASIAALQTVIILLLIIKTRPLKPQTQGVLGAVRVGGIVDGIYKEIGHKYMLLQPQEELYFPNISSNADRLEIRKRWDQLLPLGSGIVSIPEWKQDPFLNPPIADEPLYEASWTHALRCLYYSVDSYHQLVLAYNHRASTDFKLEKEPNAYDAAHCFEYLRSSILCNLDMALEEGQFLHKEEEGQEHVCRDREAAVRWIERRRVDDRKDINWPGVDRDQFLCKY